MLVADPYEHEKLDKLMTLPWMKAEIEEMLKSWEGEKIAEYISDIYFNTEQF